LVSILASFDGEESARGGGAGNFLIGDVSLLVSFKIQLFLAYYNLDH
jgi:hypothetical protein